jgi:hypothetical protein
MEIVTELGRDMQLADRMILKDRGASITHDYS